MSETRFEIFQGKFSESRLFPPSKFDIATGVTRLITVAESWIGNSKTEKTSKQTKRKNTPKKFVLQQIKVKKTLNPYTHAQSDWEQHANRRHAHSITRWIYGLFAALTHQPTPKKPKQRPQHQQTRRNLKARTRHKPRPSDTLHFPAHLRVEFLLKTDSVCPRDAGVFSLIRLWNWTKKKNLVLLF